MKRVYKTISVDDLDKVWHRTACGDCGAQIGCIWQYDDKFYYKPSMLLFPLDLDELGDIAAELRFRTYEKLRATEAK